MPNAATSSLTKKGIQKICGDPFTHGTDITLVWKDRESFQRIFDAVREAKELICLQFYIFRDDETGRELAAILKQKAGEGVAVYIIYDHFGSLFTPRSSRPQLFMARRGADEIVGGLGVATLLVSRGPLSPAQVERLRGHCQRLGFEVVVAPGRQPPEP